MVLSFHENLHKVFTIERSFYKLLLIKWNGITLEMDDRTISHSVWYKVCIWSLANFYGTKESVVEFEEELWWRKEHISVFRSLCEELQFNIKQMDKLLGHDHVNNLLHKIVTLLGVPKSLSHIEQVHILVDLYFVHFSSSDFFYLWNKILKEKCFELFRHAIINFLDVETQNTFSSLSLMAHVCLLSSFCFCLHCYMFYL